MIMEIFSIYDTKVQTFSTPFFAANIGSCARMIFDVVSDPNTTLARHPNDYVLYSLGVFNSANGDIVVKKPENLGIIRQFLPNPPAVSGMFDKGEK